MRILIVGGTGFVGKSFADWAARGKNVELVILASRQPERSAGRAFLNTVARNPSVQLVTTGTPEFLQAVTNCDAAIYAASSSDARDYQAGDGIVSADLSNMRSYLSLHRPSTPLIYLSSGAVYGRQPFDVSAIAEDQGGWDDEPGKALYASIKRQAETELTAYCLETGCSVSIARLFAFCGPWLPIDQHFLIGNMIGAIEARTAISVRAPFAVFRSYMEADDLSRALWELMANPKHGASGPINIGSSEAYEMHDFGITLADRYDLPYVGLMTVALAETKADRYIPSVRRMSGLLGIGFESDLSAIVQYVMERRAQLGLSVA